MNRTRLNPISKKKCRQHNLECKELCSQCERPIIANEYKTRKPINSISKKKRQQIEDEKPIREALYKRANGRCEKCGRLESNSIGGLHPHELLFRSHGGRLSMDSQILCHVCHSIAHRIKVVEH